MQIIWIQWTHETENFHPIYFNPYINFFRLRSLLKSFRKPQPCFDIESNHCLHFSSLIFLSIILPSRIHYGKRSRFCFSEPKTRKSFFETKPGEWPPPSKCVYNTPMSKFTTDISNFGLLRAEVQVIWP